MTQSRTDVESRLRDARARFISGRFVEAVGLIESVVADHANQPGVLLECARSFGYCYEIERAEELLESVLAAASGEMYPAIGMAFQQIFRPERAVSVLEELKNNDKLPLPMQAQLAKLYEQSNRPDEAIDALKTCVQQAPTQPQPKVLLARLHRQTRNLGEAAKLLDAVVSSSAPTATMVHAWSELALVFDQQGDYGQSIDAMENAKSLLRELPEVQQQAKRSTAINVAFQKLYAQLDSAHIRRWTDEKRMGVRTAGVAHLIGFPRSGTTLLEQMIGAHPQIHAAPERTVFTKAIFPSMCQQGALSIDALEKCSQDQRDELRSRYVISHESISGQILDDLILLDKNPNHTSLLVGLFRLFPESKFVFALRDPRDVIVSTYLRFFSLTEFSASYLTWKSTCELYVHEMNVWLKMRSLIQENWIEIKYEDTVDDPQRTTRDVAKFLGVPWNEAMVNYRNDAPKFVYSPTHAEVRKPVYTSSVGRWRHYEQYLAPHLETLAPFVKAFGYE